MSTRAAKSGFAAEAQRKVEASFDTAEATKCLTWMKAVGVDDADESNNTHDAFYEMLKDGNILCKFMDKLLPGKINWNDKTFQTPKIEAMRLMRERERIALFNKMTVQYGVSDTFTFPTESLHDKGALNLAQVCVAIRAIGMEAQSKGVGPADYWPKKSQKNVREFSEEQLNAGKSVIGLQAGTNKGASQAGMSMGKQRMIAD